MMTEDLLDHVVGRDLVNEAIDAVRIVLAERGVHGHALELQWQEASRGKLRKSGVTNQCDFCGRNFGVGFVGDRDQRFCSHACLKEARLLEVSIGIAPDLIEEHAIALKNGPCPVCKRQRSTVEMRPYYQIVSMVWFVHRTSAKELCCKACGSRNNIVSLFVCVLAGWWSLPGLFVTPIKIFQNLSTALRKDALGPPSAALMYKARLDLAERLIAAGALAGRTPQSEPGVGSGE